MDAVTHIMTGVVIGAIASAKNDRVYPAMLTGAVAASAPDIDVFLKFVSMDFFHQYHRVFTHSVFVLPILAALSALPAYLWKRRYFSYLYAVSLAVIVSHVFLDMLCVWPIMPFYPFSDKNYAMDLFGGRDTSYVALFLSTAAAMVSMYLHDRRQKRLERLAANESS